MEEKRAVSPWTTGLTEVTAGKHGGGGPPPGIADGSAALLLLQKRLRVALVGHRRSTLQAAPHARDVREVRE